MESFMYTEKMKREGDLFDAWEREHKRQALSNFCPDGIVNGDFFGVEYPKVLFVLKETSSLEGGFSLKSFLNKGAKNGAQTFNNVARWTAIIRRFYIDGVEEKWENLKNVNEGFRKEQLRHVAVMNLKKVSGGPEANNDSIKSAAYRDKIFIQKQFDLYNADIVICGGVFDLFTNVVDLKNIELSETDRGFRYGIFGNSKNQLILDSYHPAARTNGKFLAYSLFDTVSKLTEVYKLGR
jgi:hypothetical protein